MKLFWPVYLSTAIIGSAAIYCIAPRLRPRPKPAPGEERKEKAAPHPAAAAEPPAAAAHPAVAAEKEGDGGELEPPAALGIYPARKGDSSVWGVTRRETSVYTREGERKGTVPGGLLLSLRSVHSSSKGEMAVCSFLDDKKDPPRVCLLKKEDAVLFTGDPARLGAGRLDALRKYYALGGRIDKKRKALLVAEAEKNPHFHEYRERYEEFRAMTEQAGALEKERERAEGLDRTRLIEKLTAIRQEEASVNKRFTEARKAYNDWKAAHEDIGKVVDRDGEIVRWREEQAPLRKRIPGLAF